MNMNERIETGNSDESRPFPEGRDFFTASPDRPLGEPELEHVDRVLAAIIENDTDALSLRIGLYRVLPAVAELIRSMAEGRYQLLKYDNPLLRQLKKFEELSQRYKSARNEDEIRALNVEWGYHLLSFLNEAEFSWDEITDLYRTTYSKNPDYWPELNEAANRLKKPPLFDIEKH